MANKKTKVISPAALDSGQLERVGKVISNITGENVVVENDVDDKMLGGIIVKFGTKEIDLSLENMVKQIEEELNE